MKENPSDQQRIDAAIARQHAALHAVQSGVKAEIAFENRANVHADLRSSGPKHLRTGVNSALCNSAAIARLLIAKGVFTEAEYHEAVATQMETEKARLETHLSRIYGTKVTLG